MAEMRKELPALPWSIAVFLVALVCGGVLCWREHRGCAGEWLDGCLAHNERLALNRHLLLRVDRTRRLSLPPLLPGDRSC